MLVLSRKKGESLVIGEDIVIKILGTEGDQVKIGIEAPRYVEIHRQEVYEAIQQENRLAGTNQKVDLEQLKRIGHTTGGIKINKG